MNETVQVATRTRIAVSAAWLAVLVLAVSLEAHHAGIMYAPTPLWVAGTVVQFEDIDPHTITTIEERDADGQVRRWAIEGPARFQIDDMGIRADAPRVGEVVTFCAFPYKSGAELSRLFPDAVFSGPRFADSVASPRFVEGHVMVRPNGERRLWDPHGILGECIRSSDEPRQAWLNFLNSSPRALRVWCEQRQYAHVRSTPALGALVEEVDGRLDAPCR